MTRIQPLTSSALAGAHQRTTKAQRVNPASKLAVSVVIGATLVFSIDVVSAAVALIGELLLLPFAGLGWRMFWRRTAPVWIAALFASVTTVLYGSPTGAIHLEFGVITISDGSIQLASATFLRILAIALPAVVLFARVDATDLADSLYQLLRLPPRFVLGALAGLRLASLFREDWRALELARRARGLSQGRVLARFAGQAFALLVIAIRRGTKLATAMEARGFGSEIPRTWARRSTVGWLDAAILAVGFLISGAAAATSLALGAWNPVLGG